MARTSSLSPASSRVSSWPRAPPRSPSPARATSTDLNSKATTTWLTVKVADAMGTRDTITWVPTGSFASSAEERVPRYPMTAIQGKDTKELTLSAVRNEQVSAQLAIASGQNLDDVKAVVGDLTGPGGAKLSGDDTQVRFVKYVPVQRSKSEVDWSATIDQVSSGKEVSGDRNPDVVGDALEERSSVDVPAYAAQPLWFTFHIPEKAAPGTYSGTVKVNADGRTQTTLPADHRGRGRERARPEGLRLLPRRMGAAGDDRPGTTASSSGPTSTGS